MSKIAIKNSAKRQEAIVLIAEGDRTQANIARLCEVDARTLTRWLVEPDFKASVKALQDENADALKGEGIRRKDNRLSRYQDIVKRIYTVIDERAEEMGLVGSFTASDGATIDLTRIPGGQSGLLARNYDKLGNTVYKFDAAIVRELLNTMKQAAQEMGQWIDRAEVDMPGTVIPEINVYQQQPGASES